VIVNPSPFGSCALVVTPGNVTVIPLPWLDFNAATQRAQVLLAAQRDAERNRTPISRANLRQTMTSLLRWLWDTVADPVLSTIDTDRVHWCPTGPMTFLPLHAAGRYQKGHKSAGRTVPDRVVSSYTTTLTALLRSAAPSPDTPRLLAVGMPATPGLAPLPAVQDELTQIAASVPGASTLVGPAATEAAVLSELDRHSWVHFACHGTQNADNPAESAIHLHDAPLTVTKLAAHGLRNAELAYLSACHTATGSTQLADEAIHLTAALQAAGYRHVIGTQWSITDEHAADVAGAVYRELADRNVTRRDPAAALAHAVAPLRAAYQDRPEIWAPYIHTGPR
jgi:CHAT domain-containing protein